MDKWPEITKILLNKSTAYSTDARLIENRKKSWAEQKTLTGRPRRRRRQGYDNSSCFFKSQAKKAENKDKDPQKTYFFW